MLKKSEDKQIKVFSTYIQSEIIAAKMALEHEGIEFFTQNEDFASLYPTPGVGDVDFFVYEADFKKARAALSLLIKGSME
ncbi:MAG: DUF2007 domain-containing protein [Bacteroidetes bacterium]|nr:DUF2007 domain-containing protein [Bacteroidota bacterium]MCL5738110.1 DUF2007 domain-containing protein [Bacteroidota bacterium]